MNTVNIILIILSLILILTVVEVLIMILKKPAKELPDAKDYSYYHMIPVKKEFVDLYLFLVGDETAPYFADDEVYGMLYMPK